METRVLLIFDLFQRTIKPRLDAFDKCRVFEIKNPALLLAFACQEIKDIKRENVLRMSVGNFQEQTDVNANILLKTMAYIS